MGGVDCDEFMLCFIVQGLMLRLPEAVLDMLVRVPIGRRSLLEDGLCR